MTIRQRLTILIVLTFLALAFIGGFAVFQSRTSSSEVKMVTEGVVPSALASVEMMSQLKDVQIATLAMVSAKQANEVAKTQEDLGAKKAALQTALHLQMKQADSEAQKGLLKQAEESLANYFASIEDTAKFKLAGQQELAEANMAATVDQYLREQVSVIETVQIEKRRSKDEAIAAVNRNLGNTTTTLAAITMLAVVTLTAIGLLLYRQITRPISEMQAKMTEIASSQDFTHRVPVDRMDEIGRSIAAFNAMIEKIQSSSQLIQQKTADIQAMLHYIPQGILTVVPGNTVHAEYSSYLETILQTQDIAGRNFMELVFAEAGCGADALSQIETAVSACIGEDRMNFEFNAHLLITEIEKTMPDGRVKVLDLSWSPITDERDTVVRMMLCLWDVTELRQLKAQAQEQKRELAIIGEVLAVPQEKFHAFVDGSTQFIADNEALLRQAGDEASAAKASDIIAQLFRNMHTVKGNARTYGLLHLTNLVHVAEQTYDDMRKAPDTVWDKGLMRDQLARVSAMLQEYLRIHDVKLGRKGPGRRGGVDQKLQDVLADVLDSLPSLARELGKEAPRVVVQDNGIVVRSQAADLLKNVCMHLCRNALDHGIETAEERIALGKSAAGEVRLALALQGDRLTLRLSDDGRGLAVGAIARKALQSQLITAGQALTQEEIAQLIFKPGFSTAEQVTEVSGRGVGMDAVKGFVQAEGGSIALRFVSEDTGGDFRPFETVISLPGKFAATRQASSHSGQPPDAALRARGAGGRALAAMDVTIEEMAPLVE